MSKNAFFLLIFGIFVCLHVFFVLVQGFGDFGARKRNLRANPHWARLEMSGNPKFRSNMTDLSFNVFFDSIIGLRVTVLYGISNKIL